MGFEESIAALSQRADKLVDDLQTEEAAKTGLVMPFLAALGYDVFNPREVVPEFTADVGTKKGEKVDYAVKRDGEIIMLVECKKAGCDLSEANFSQLFRYFSVTSARIGILTNGTQYRFFSDLEQPNKMDVRPFLEVDLLELSDGALAEIGKLSKERFDLERMLSSATDLKYLREMRRILSEQLDEPSEELARFFHSHVCDGARFTSTAKGQFTDLTRRALRQFIGDRVRDRLRTALEKEDRTSGALGDDADGATATDDDGIETTIEELEAFHIVKAIVREVVEPKRVGHRDTKSYMGVLLDDNNRKPVCRLRFNRKQKYLGLFGENKQEKRVPIESLNDIFQYGDELKAAAVRYE